MAQALRILVIGAGICGVSAAIWLRRAGHDVTLIDRDHPGAGASFGNAGLLADWAVAPVNTPDLPLTALKYLANPRSPLFVQWGALPRLAPWLWQYLRNSRPKRVARAVAALTALVGDSLAEHQTLTRGTRAERWIAKGPIGFAYPSRRAFDADATTWRIKRQAGFEPEIIEGAAIREVEPMLSSAIGCLALLREHGYILDPGSYLADLADVLRQEGGRYLQAEARDFVLEGGRIAAVDSDQGRLECDRAVVAAGILSEPLMRRLGLRVPLIAERGYHLHFRDPSQMPRMPMMISEGKFGVNPMATGLRCAGTVELGDTRKPAARAPLELIARHVARVFPGLEYSAVEKWMGFRPSTPDSLPLIGEIGHSGIFAAFGHQHVGLTSGPRTGRLVAALIGGQTPNIDLTPFDPGRFA